MDKRFFEQDIKGFLFFIEHAADGSERAKLIFEFNKTVLNKLREGDIIAVEAFPSLTIEGEKYYTLFEVTKISPTHITIDRLRRYRFMGAVREFLKEATKDFEAEDPTLIRDHVYVEVEAVITGYTMKAGSKLDFINEPCKPILGRDAGVLNSNAIEAFINKGVDKGIIVGKLFSAYEAKEVEVKVKPHRLITHHYTIFGFTGAGKSNLNSVIISRLLSEGNIKIVIFDLADEYTALLIDKILSSGIVLIDENNLPESVIAYLQVKWKKKKTGDSKLLIQASNELAETVKKPGIYDSSTFISVYREVFKEALKSDKIRILKFSPEEVFLISTVQEFFDELERRATTSWDRRHYQNMLDILPRYCEEEGVEFKEDLAEWSIEEFNNFEEFINGLCDRIKASDSFRSTVEAILARMERAHRLVEKGKESITEEEHAVNVNWVIKNFVEEEKGDYNLCIIVSSEKDKLTSILATIITRSLEIRRHGTRKHSVLFVVDEGHEFVINPRESGLSEDERTSSRVIERLTRMGRKYGLGVCIASQRVAHLNTTAISNCHTTFVGALPRKYDRDTMNEAYAISQDVLNQVVTFPPGNWYLVSMIATGIKNVPIKIVAPNREKELAEFFREKKYLNDEQVKILRDTGYLQNG